MDCHSMIRHYCHYYQNPHCLLLEAMAAVSSKWCLEALNSIALLWFEIKAIKECNEEVKVEEVHCDCRLPESVSEVMITY